MSVALAPSPVFQGLGFGGLALPGGKLYSFIAGTSTPQATYTDSTETTQNTNPVILNANGQGNVWLDETLTYKLRLTDSAGNQIWVIDNIPGGFSLTQASIGQLLYPQTPAEVIAGVTPINYYVPPYHVLRYGTNSAPGTTDMSAAILAAVSVAQASPNSRWVYFDPDVYATPGITLSGTLQSIKFQGNGAVIQNLTTNNALITVGTADDLEFDGLYFVGNSSAAQLSGHYGLSLLNTGRTRIVNCNFNHLSVGIYNQNTLTDTFTGAVVQIPIQISGNTITNCDIGIYTEDAGTGSGEFGEYCRISNNTITLCTNWGIFNRAGNTAIIGNSVVLNFGGISISEAGSFNGDHGLIVGNTVNHNNRANLYITNTLRSMIVSGNNFWACLSAPLSSPTPRLNGSFGVYLEQCSNIIFTDNVVARNAINMGTFDITNCVIADNCFLTDPANTTLQYTESFTYTTPNFNAYGPNQFVGALSTGLTVTGNPNGDQPVTLTGGWATFGSGFAPPSYFKDAFNIVHLKGVITGGTIGSACFTLPATFVPTDGIRVFACMSNNAFGVLNINTSGQVIPVMGNTASFCLDGVSFRSGDVPA